MTTLADKAILSGDDNRPPMLEKDMYDSWKSRMELYMMNRQHGRMILESVENGPLIWPLIEENGVTRPKKYFELSAMEEIQADYALTEVHNPDNMDNNMINEAVHAMPSSEQSNVVNHSETKITSDSNIIPYSQYVIESQQATIQNSNSSAQQDALILSVIEQLKTLVVNCTKINLDNKSVNDTLTDDLERYKEQVKVLKDGKNVDLKSNDNILDSSAQSVEIDRLKQTLSEHLKEKESLIQTVTLLKNDFKKEESRNIDREIALEKRIKQLDNINSMNSLDSTPSNRPTKVEVPKELPKLSMVNTSLKKLKHYLAGFDVVIKERTTTIAITKGSWGKPTALENETPKLVVTLVYLRKPRKSKTNVPISKSKVVQIVLLYLDSGCSKHMTGDRSQLTNFVNKFLGTVKFRNDHVAKILGYGDYQIGNVTISRVYYVEGLGYNLFSVGQFCDSNLKVAFR
ncbi:hypothetical protein Tco_0759144 [Tanacetum coccineum]